MQPPQGAGWEPRARELVRVGRLKAALELIPNALQEPWESQLSLRVTQQPDEVIDLEGLTDLAIDRGWLGLAYAASGAGLASAEGAHERFLGLRAATLKSSDPERAQMVFDAACHLAERKQSTAALKALAQRLVLEGSGASVSDALFEEILSDEIAMTEFLDFDDAPLEPELLEGIRARLAPLGIKVL